MGGGVDAVDPRYRVLYERAAKVVGAGPRVLAVDVSGSIAAGKAERWSDLDLQIVAELGLDMSGRLY